jgi:hypothetical protein
MALSSFVPPASSGEPYRYEELNDFTGGLNLRADQSSLAPNESPDLLNVDVDPRGGVERRDNIDALNTTALNGDILMIADHFETTSGTEQIIVAAKNSAGTGTELWFGTGGNFTLIEDATGVVTLTGVSVPSSVTFNDSTYISNGELFDSPADKSALRWRGGNSGTALTLGVGDWGANGHFPQARFTTTWGERVWAAYTTEASTDRASLIRWSKINDAENWLEADYIEVDIGEHGDAITAIVPDGDRLLVFKQESVYAIYGFDSDTFQVVNLTRAAGCRSGTVPVATPLGVFFWYAEEGLFLLSQQGLAHIFSRLKPAVENGFLTLSNAPSLMWFDQRLWLSVDFQSGDNHTGSSQSGRRNIFILDGSLGEGGAWTRHDINARWLWAYRPPGDTHLALMATSDVDLDSVPTGLFTRVSKAMQNNDKDDYTGAGSQPIRSHYQTRWLSGNRPTFPKRWGKTRTILLTDNTVRVSMQILKDYNASGATVLYSKDLVGDSSTAVWGTARWGIDSWVSLSNSRIYKFFRWPSAGTAKAISIRFSIAPDDTYGHGKWGMTSIVGMYRTRRIR